MGSKPIHALQSSNPDGIYLLCLQKGLEPTIKYLIKAYRGSVAMGYILKPWRDIKVVLIPKPGRNIAW